MFSDPRYLHDLASEGPDFELFEQATSPLIEAFSPRGVTRIEYAPGFVEPYDFSVWLGTTNDAERDALQADEQLVADVSSVLKAAGLEDPALMRGVVVQSQETVNRDHEGSWFYAMR